MAIDKLKTPPSWESARLVETPPRSTTAKPWLEGLRSLADKRGPAAVLEVVLAGLSAATIKALLGTPTGRAAFVGIAARLLPEGRRDELDAFAVGLDQLSELRPPPAKAAQGLARLLETTVANDPSSKDAPVERDDARADKRERPRKRETWVAFETPKELQARLETIDQLMETQPYGYLYAAQRFADPTRLPDAVKSAREQAALAAFQSLRELENRAAAEADLAPRRPTRSGPLQGRPGGLA